MKGKGGGKPESAQASGTNVACLKEAIAKALAFGKSRTGGSAGSAPAPQASAPQKSAPQKSAPTSSINPLEALVQVLAKEKGVKIEKGKEGGIYIKIGNEIVSGCAAVSLYLANQELKGGSNDFDQSRVLQWLYYAQNHLVHYAQRGKVKSLKITMFFCKLDLINLFF
jgi:hypothetical protein